MSSEFTKDGYVRRMYSDAVHWTPQNKRRVEYFVARFPFVPDYHLCELVEDYYDKRKPMFVPHVCEKPLQQFKTLSQALDVLKVIEGSQS